MPLGSYNRKDHYYRKAKEVGFRSRAAFKLIELDSKFGLFREGMNILDLGCSPGSWLQVLASAVGPTGTVIGIDLDQISPPPLKNITFIQGDVREERTKQRLLAELGRKVDLVVSDLAPHLSGVKFQDQYNSYELAEQALKLCRLVLKASGTFVVKIFPGDEMEQFQVTLRRLFPRVKLYVPRATRKRSSEVYLIAKGYRGPTNGNNHLH